MGRHSAPKPITPAVPVRQDVTETQKLSAVSARVPRRELRLAKKAAKRRLRTRASAAAVSSLMAGFGAASVISGTAQTAAAQTPNIPVTTSLTQSPTVSASVPASLAGMNGAHERAQLLSAQEVAADTEPAPAICETAQSANGMFSTVMTSADDRLVVPLKEGTYRMSSHYGARWNPFSGGYQHHLGSDYAAELGTPIYAIGSGTVEYVGEGKDGRSSNLVIIKHDIDGEVFWSWYVHMYADGIHVAEGDEVDAGQHIADVGNNGQSTGPHLHLEIHTDADGTTVNAFDFLAERGAQDVSEICA